MLYRNLLWRWRNADKHRAETYAPRPRTWNVNTAETATSHSSSHALPPLHSFLSSQHSRNLSSLVRIPPAHTNTLLLRITTRLVGLPFCLALWFQLSLCSFLAGLSRNTPLLAYNIVTLYTRTCLYVCKPMCAICCSSGETTCNIWRPSQRYYWSCKSFCHSRLPLWVEELDFLTLRMKERPSFGS